MTDTEKSLYQIIYETVKRIPKGKVATYGQIARLCGLREHARLVGYALHNLRPNSGVPWQRVINSKGMISLRRDTGAYEHQKRILEKEGVKFKNEKIDLAKYGIMASEKIKTRPGGGGPR
ncbi:MAG TPA: MGMT family protein [Candidatus Acidoferrales bacterium]|nr:MGMT family protein [Candidatus Acidoferrales bacterium]